jgi:EAL domain-containing protein (putative c-di-GMP-specific phosphodiesterase class I)
MVMIFMKFSRVDTDQRLARDSVLALDSNRRPLRVVVVDDHEMILQSVVRLLTADPRIDVVGTALSGAEGIESVLHLEPDVLVIDYHLPDMNAPEAIKILLEAAPDLKIVTISGAERPDAFYESMRAGSAAWVKKTRAIQELRVAILTVAAGEPYVSEELTAQPRLDQLVLHFQPIVSLDDWAIIGFEALVRWQHPELGLLFPTSFLPHAALTGFIEEIDRWVLHEALQQLAVWKSAFPRNPSLFVAVNMSKASLAEPRLTSTIAVELESSGVEAEDLIIEVSESILVANPEEVVELLTKLDDVGVRLALEDFGASFSAISYIHRMPFGCVKIGRTFTQELPESLGTVWLIEGIRNVTDATETMCVAEGIEEMAQCDALRDAGVRYGQGFLFSPPVRVSVCDALLARPSLMAIAVSEAVQSVVSSEA